jgi:hypothetical protein
MQSLKTIWTHCGYSDYLSSPIADFSRQYKTLWRTSIVRIPTLAALGLAALAVFTANDAGAQSLSDQLKASAKANAAERARLTTAVMSQIRPAVTAAVLNECKVRAEAPHGLMQIASLKVVSPFSPSAALTCLRINNWKRDRIFAIYTATTERRAGYTGRRDSDKAECEIEINNGRAIVVKAGGAQTEAPPVAVSQCAPWVR